MPSRLKISQFAHIEDIDLELGDLTVLVGPQGSGKSIALQLFKLGHDRYEVVSALRDAAEVFDDPPRFRLAELIRIASASRTRSRASVTLLLRFGT